MFRAPHYIGNSFSVVFPRVQNIRRKANSFEDRLEMKYQPPQIVSVPDDLDPGVPRMIFNSKDGFSQIVVSQVNFVLNVQYSPEWQHDTDRGRRYIEKNISYLYGLFDFLSGVKPSFCGMTTQVLIPSSVDEASLLNELVRLYLKPSELSDLHDIQVKITNIRSQQFFSNITIENYRASAMQEVSDEIIRLRRGDATEIGIRVVSDFNDRYSFNEHDEYISTRDIAKQVIAGGFTDVQSVINELGVTQ